MWATDLDLKLCDVGWMVKHHPTDLESFIQYCRNTNPGILALAVCIATNIEAPMALEVLCGLPHKKKEYRPKCYTARFSTKMLKKVLKDKGIRQDMFSLKLGYNKQYISSLISAGNQRGGCINKEKSFF